MADADIVVPGLPNWRETIAKAARSGREGGEDAEDLAAAGQIGPRWIDIYVWAVLLGNVELATMLLPACQEPMRAAVIGARIFQYMAEKMPLNAVELTKSATSQEDWATASSTWPTSRRRAAC